MTYNSNTIEGNTLTLKETALVIQEGITIKGKPLKDHLEAKNQKEADANIAGQYRESNVIITGADHTPPEDFEVANEMQKLIKWINSNRKNYILSNSLQWSITS